MTNFSKVIEAIRDKRGRSLAILGHHYQSDAVIQHADLRGDSLELSRRIDSLDATDIVFCGVYFMAESAAILRRPDQRVYIPDESAGCVMSNMAPAHLVDTVLKRLNEGTKRVVPLAYVNTSAGVKAVVGRFGGAVCTSANAKTMLDWALGRGDAVLFLPDRNLGWNTADALGLSESERLVLDVRRQGNHVSPDLARSARLLLWPGLCAIHQRFDTATIGRIRAGAPQARIAVHPECPPPVVRAADASGSTSFLIRYVQEAPDGATLYVGTEANLVERLADQHRGRKTVLPLRVSLCSNMAKTTEQNLARLLQFLDEARPVDVPEDVLVPARAALSRMLAATS